MQTYSVDTLCYIISRFNDRFGPTRFEPAADLAELDEILDGFKTQAAPSHHDSFHYDLWMLVRNQVRDLRQAKSA
jgi:hypothetical protein